MRRFVTDDGRTFLIPGDAQERPREPVERSVASGFYACECHEKMGNDFYFLPAKSCLRTDKQCNNPNWSKEPERAADGNSYRYHATGLPAGGDKP